MKQSLRLVVLVLLLMSGSALAMRWTVRTSEPMKDENWPQGSLDVVNLKSRIGYEGGDPGFTKLYFQGDTAAFQDALDRFAMIRWPQLQLILRDGPQQVTFYSCNPSTEVIDWSLTVWDPTSWYRMIDFPILMTEPMPPPSMEVYIGDGKIDWKLVKFPQHITVIDERAAAPNEPNGASLSADVYDILTSKPISGARLAVGQTNGREWNSVSEAKSDALGHCELRGFPPQHLSVCVFADGYAPKVIDSDRFSATTSKQFFVHLSPLATASGTVVDTDGKPVSGAKLILMALHGPDGENYPTPTIESLLITTDEKGRFELNGIPQGSVGLVVPPLNHQSEIYSLYETPNKEIVIHLRAPVSSRAK